MTVCITQDLEERARLAATSSSAGVLIMVPDRMTALSVLGNAVFGMTAAGGESAIPVMEPSGGEPQALPESVTVLDELIVDRERARVSWAGRPVELTHLEIEVLACLTSHPGKVWSYERLHVAAWGSRYLGDRNSVHSLVKRLRRKLRESGVALELHAVRGVGFQLIPLVELAAYSSPL